MVVWGGGVVVCGGGGGVVVCTGGGAVVAGDGDGDGDGFFDGLGFGEVVADGEGLGEGEGESDGTRLGVETSWILLWSFEGDGSDSTIAVIAASSTSTPPSFMAASSYRTPRNTASAPATPITNATAATIVRQSTGRWHVDRGSGRGALRHGNIGPCPS